MPIVDLDQKNGALTVKDRYDYTIIGSGAIGIFLSLKLTRKGFKVQIFESGKSVPDAEKDSLNRVCETGKKFTNAIWCRKRILGGTTTAWGGQSLPFSRMDFEARDWMEDSEWPLKADDLEPYYREANLFMGIDALNYASEIFPRISLKDPFAENLDLYFHVSKWAPQPNFIKSHGDELKKSCDVFLNSHVTKIHLNHKRRVDSVEVKNSLGEAFLFSTNTLVVAAGGIESVRLLLQFREDNGDRFGEALPRLGKGFMEHPCIEIGTVNTSRPFELQRKFNTHRWRRWKYGIRISTSEKFLKEKKLLQCSASINFMMPVSRPDPFRELKLFLETKKLYHFIQAMRCTVSILNAAFAYPLGFYYKKNAQALLSLMAEQKSMDQSFISLGESKDQYGRWIANIYWSIDFSTWRSIVEFSKTLKESFEKNGLGSIQLHDGIRLDNPNWLDLLSDVNHHMGGTAMGRNSEKSVVDQNLKVFGTENLYVCGTSVFRTSSHSNPTLTAMALAGRLADFFSPNSL